MFRPECASCRLYLLATKCTCDAYSKLCTIVYASLSLDILHYTTGAKCRISIVCLSNYGIVRLMNYTQINPHAHLGAALATKWLVLYTQISPLLDAMSTDRPQVVRMRNYVSAGHNRIKFWRLILDK